MEDRKQIRHLESWIDEQIRQAQERGEFDDLPGKGKPLDLTPNPYALDRELAFKVLKDAGYAPDWIELDKSIRVKLDALRARLALSWAWHKSREWELGDGMDAAVEVERMRSAASWQETVAGLAGELEEINKLIAELNLKVPGPRFQRKILVLEREVERIASEGP
jgi:DnaJ family protein C protein 28